MSVAVALSLDEVLESSKASPSQLQLINFWSAWAEPCVAMNEVFAALSATHPGCKFWEVDPEVVADAALHFMVEAVPTFVFIRGGQEVARVNGAQADLLVGKTEELLAAPGTTNKGQDTLTARLLKLINCHPFMIFIKGTPSMPRCGFTRQLLTILSEQQIEYDYFDILQDEEVRQALKEYSSWPTYPQIYFKGELVGGLDILKEMVESGQLKELVAASAQ